MFGFIAWVWVPVLVFFCHIAVIEFQMSKPHYSPDTIFISAGVCLLWCLREELFHIPFGFFLLASTLAIHIQIAIQMALKEQKRKDFEVFVVALSSWLFGSTSLFYCIFLWGANDKKLAFFIMSALVILTAGSIARRHLSQFRSKRQVMELGLSLIGSTSTLVPILMIGRGI